MPALEKQVSPAPASSGKEKEREQREEEEAKVVDWAPSKAATSCCQVLRMILVVKASIIFVCVFVLLYQSWKCLSRYRRADTSATMEVRPTAEAAFLAFTVCPAFEAAYRDAALSTFGTTREAYQSGDYRTNDRGDLLTPRQVYEELVYDLPEILFYLQLRTASEYKDRVNVSLSQDDNEHGRWRVRYNNLYGRCFSFELDRATADLGVTRVEAESFINTFIFLHHPGQFMDFNSKTKLPVTVSQKLFIDINYENTINTLEDDSSLPCNPGLDDTFDDCMDGALPDMLDSEFGCTIPYLPGPEEYPICDADNLTLIDDVIHRYKFLGSNGQRRLCEKPCSDTEVFTGLPFFSKYKDGNTGTGYIKVYLKSTTKVKKTVLDYTWVSMLAEIGGYSGLMLGISLVNLTALIDRAYNRNKH